MIEKFQQGGQLDQIFNAINSQPEQALQQLVQSGAKPEDIVKIVQAGVQQGKIKPEIGQAILQAMQGQKVAARHGIKLNYIKSLKNKCAEDEEVVYYKKGGSVKCGCKKKEEGGEVTKAKCGSTVDKFKKVRKGGFGIGGIDTSRIGQLSEANKQRKAQEEQRKKKAKTWGGQKTYYAGSAPISPEDKDTKAYNKGHDDHTKPGENKKTSTKEKGGEIKKDCNGAVAKFKAKCGSKLKKK